ncbi:alpha/beta hydrolase [Jatrophihabitans sp. YIM 134969]
MSEERVVLDATTRRFVEQAAVAEARSPEAFRRAYDALFARDTPRPVADVLDVDTGGGPHEALTVRLVRPVTAHESAAPPWPAVVYAHGGGWVAGGLATCDRIARELAVRADCAVVVVDYTVTPAAGFPVALEQVYSVLEWVRQRGAAFGLDPERVAVAGDSVGATLATAAALVARQRSGPTLAGQLLLCPWTTPDADTGSARTFAEGLGLRRDTVDHCWHRYAGPDRIRHLTAAPGRARAEDLVGLPPALVVTAGADPTRDEAESYAATLRAAGVRVTAVRYEGAVHDFVTADALRHTSTARAALDQAAQFLVHVLR